MDARLRINLLISIHSRDPAHWDVGSSEIHCLNEYDFRNLVNASGFKIVFTSILVVVVARCRKTIQRTIHFPYLENEFINLFA